ncbi:MAG: hypothetical protein EB125_06245 [Betaproteobacteria bacterium]|nr:hypothetical protein [Betaproteobacteria bacterium]
MSKPTKPSISTRHENNFTTLIRAFKNDDVALMLCTDAKTGEYATVICICNLVTKEDGEPEYQFIPVATMIEGNPYEAYIPPNDGEDDGNDGGPNTVSPTDADTKH